MSLSELLKKTPWAIQEDTLETIYTILMDHNKGVRYDLDEIEAKIGKKLANKTRGVTMVDNVAVIPVIGVIAPRMDLFSAISGGVSAETLIQNIETALEDPDVDAIVLKMDSPGGTVNGTKQVGDLIYRSRGIKPIYTHVSGTMASGGLWIGTASERVSAIDTADIGSIGVVMSHTDYSKMDEKEGIKRTFITAGKYKRIVNNAEPLSEEGRAYLQELLDDYYDLFITAVAQHRGVTKQVVLDKMADGRMFVAPKALERGIIDSIESIETTIELAAKAAENHGTGGKSNPKKVVEKQTTGGKEQMDIKELKEKHPDLYNSLIDKGKVQAKAESEEIITALKNENTTLKEENSKLKTSSDDLKKDIIELQKKDAIREEREIKTIVENIWSAKLNSSSLPVTLHSKVRNCIDQTDHMKDGSLDVKSFETAIKEEIKDWESKLDNSSSVVLGHSYTKKVKHEDADSSDDEWVESMLAKSGDTEALGGTH